MKYCSKCGKELFDEAVICPNCGCVVGKYNDESLGFRTPVLVFMIIGTIINAIFGFLIPLAWCIPMTVVYSNKTRNRERVGIGFKICSLLFVNFIAGILMLCDVD